jgi:hypothetical protein
VQSNALRRAVGAIVVLAAAFLLLGNGTIDSTFALFNGQTQNANSAFAGGWVGAPTAATATAVGYDMSLGWTPGTHGPVTGQQLHGVDNGTNSNCTGAAYSLLATMATASTATYTDASRGTAVNNGNWFCYQLLSTSATSWTAPLALGAVQLGLVVTGVQITNAGGGGGAGVIQRTDTIRLTFNQRVAGTFTTTKVCVYTSGVILLGDGGAGSTCGGAGGTFTIGKLTVTGATIGTQVGYTATTVARSTVAPWTMTFTLQTSNTTSAVTGTPTWSFTGSSSVTSFATTHPATLCSSAATTCKPTTATNF